MPSREQESPQGGDQQPLAPFELPSALAEFLAGETYAMVTQASDNGTIYVVKAPRMDIESVRGVVPIEVRHELHQHELAPVIRTVVKIYDQLQRPLSLETFINVAEAEQWADYAQLSEQDELILAFYDETLSHRLTKHVDNRARDKMRNILNWADRIKAAIPDTDYDFDRAKADVMKATTL